MTPLAPEPESSGLVSTVLRWVLFPFLIPGWLVRYAQQGDEHIIELIAVDRERLPISDLKLKQRW
jgi:hypothetical protein